MRLPLLLSLSFLLFSSHLVLAESNRLPTNTELQKLRQSLSQSRQLLGSDRRTRSQVQKRESFVRAWSKISPQTTPFLGTWEGYEQYIIIYPSQTPKRVCVVIGGDYVDAGFKLGTIKNNQIITNDNELILRQGRYLGLAGVSGNRPFLALFHAPEIVRSFASELTASGLQRFKQAGCSDSGNPKQF